MRLLSSALAAVGLLALPASAQLVVGYDASGTGTKAWFVDVTTGVASPLWDNFDAWGIATDEVNKIIYFNDGSALYSRPYSGGIPTLIGTIMDAGGATQAPVSLAFANGKLYCTKNIANEAVWEIDTVTAVATVVLDYTDADYDFGGLDYDPASGLFYATNDDATPFGSGVYSLDVFGTGAITFIASYPPGETDIDGCAVGGGKVWLIEDEPSPLHNLDLTTLLYDPAPPMSPMTASAVFSGGSWAPGLGGSSLPEFFCTAKTTLVCGTPAIGFTGSPSATSTSGFVVSAGPARTCKSGILLYNTAQVTPGVAFQGGTLCVEPMGLRRAGSTNSMGTPGGTNCDGSFSIDMNAFANALWVVPDCAGAPSGLAPNTPAGYLLNMGQDVFCQYWGRDSVASGSFVSDGLHYQVGP